MRAPTCGELLKNGCMLPTHNPDGCYHHRNLAQAARAAATGAPLTFVTAATDLEGAPRSPAIVSTAELNRLADRLNAGGRDVRIHRNGEFDTVSVAVMGRRNGYLTIYADRWIAQSDGDLRIVRTRQPEDSLDEAVELLGEVTGQTLRSRLFGTAGRTSRHVGRHQ